MFYAVPTSRVIFTTETSLYFNIQFWTKRESKLGDNFCCTLTLGEPSPNRESNPKKQLVTAGSTLLLPSMISKGYRENNFFYFFFISFIYTGKYNLAMIAIFR